MNDLELPVAPPSSPNPTCAEMHKTVGSVVESIQTLRNLTESNHQKLNEIQDSLQSFNWFIETVNKWRNNVFWGVCKIFFVGAAITIVLFNADSFLDALRKRIAGG